VHDRDGEYVEIYNPLDVPIDLSGYTVTGQRQGKTVQLTGTLAPHSYYLLCQYGTGRTAAFGAGQCDTTFDWWLRNSGDEIILQQNSLPIDSVSWTSAYGNRQNKGLARKAGNVSPFSDVNDSTLWTWTNVTPKSGPLD